MALFFMSPRPLERSPSPYSGELGEAFLSFRDNRNLKDWGCDGGCLDIKRWYAGIITPSFRHTGHRSDGRAGDREDDLLVPPRLMEATAMLQQNNLLLNSPRPDGQQEIPKFTSRVLSPLRPGGVRTCSTCLAATALGAGALAVPYAFSLTGVGLGLLTLTFAAVVSALSLQILMVAARYTETGSYAGLLELAVGSWKASAALDAVVLLNGIGAIICILIFEGDFLPAAAASPPMGLSGIALSRGAAVVAVSVLVWPLTLSPNISALRYVTVAVPAVLFATVCIVMWDTPKFHQAVRSSGDRCKFWSFEIRSWLKAVAIMINAFANHMNAIPCANQLDDPSIARIVKATVNGNLLVWALLAALGVGGYASWASVTEGDFLLNYPAGSPEIWFCRVMLALIVFLVLPVALLPTAKSGAQLVSSLISKEERPIGPTAHAVSATVLLLACMLVALVVSDVAKVVGFLGGFLASSLMFWFPAVVFRLLLWPTQPEFFRLPVLSLLVLFGSLGYVSVLANYL